MLVICKQCTMNNKCICDYASNECNARIQAYNQAIDDFEEKLLYDIGDLGIREDIEERAKELHR